MLKGQPIFHIIIAYIRGANAIGDPKEGRRRNGPKSGGGVAPNLADAGLPELGLGRKAVPPAPFDSVVPIVEPNGAGESDFSPKASHVTPVPTETCAITPSDFGHAFSHDLIDSQQKFSRSGLN